MSSMFSISGIASGLDTDAMITSLMQVERMPITRMKSRQTSLRTVDDAWSSVTKQLSAVRDAVDSLRTGAALTDRWSASSSSESTATASRDGDPAAGSTTFTVDHLATAQSASSTTADAFASADALVDAGTFTIDDAQGDQLVSVTTDGTTSLQHLADQLDAAAGVSAQVVRADTGDHRLVLTSNQVGADGNFQVTSDITDLSTADLTVDAGTDAQLTVGNLTVQRSSNTVTDLVDGVTLHLQGAGTTTVTVEQDVASAIDDITGMVDKVNSALGKLAELTAYDPETQAGNPLTGDGTARRLVDDLRRGVADAFGTLDGATYPTAGSIGISMTREGTFEVDEAKLEAALQDDPAAVDRLVNRGLTTTLDGVRLQSATTATQAGDHAVVIDQVARVARATGAAYNPPATDPETFTITADDGTAVQVTIPAGASVTTAISQINQALDDAEVDTVTAETNASGGIDLVESRYGASTSLTVTADDLGTDGVNDTGLAVGTHTGQDVAGTIGGVTAEGSGRRLALPDSADSAAAGVALIVDPADGAVAASGTVTVTHGLAGRMDRILEAYEGSTGVIARAQEGLDGRIEMFQDRIDAFEVRMEQRRERLVRQFTGMETALDQLQSQQRWLAGQLGGLSGGMPTG